MGKAILNVKNADWYLRLLEVSNGLQIDNVMFDSAEDLIENNLEYRADKSKTQFIIFGKNGNTDSFVFDQERKAKPFLIANFYGDFSRNEEIYESFDSLEELIAFLVDERSIDA